MKYIFIVVTALLTTPWIAEAQEDAEDKKQWEMGADINFYILEDDFFVLPVLSADHDALHLEARYNYEDMETFSGWIGYNFTGGKKVTYTLTPMVGGIVGLSNGFAPGLEMSLGLGKFELYLESEYFVDVEGSNHFFYSWSDLTFAPTNWFWFGLSGQRTRLYQTDLEVQRGLLIGAGYKNFELSGYLFNAGFGETFVMLALSGSF